MSQTCHCCNQFTGDCNFDFCSPWLFSMQGPSPPDQQPFYEGDFYSFKAEFDMNSFIWSLNPELDCDHPIYKKSYSYFEFIISKVFYIDQNKNININSVIENKGLDLPYKIQIKPLLPQCFYCREYCSDTNTGISFNYPVDIGCTDFSSYCSTFYNVDGIKEISNIKVPVAQQFRIKNCSKIYTYNTTLNFNTKSYGPFWLLTLYISDYYPNYINPGLGFKNTGAINIEGITSAVCSRFSNLMMTSEDAYISSDISVKRCYVNSFYTNGTIDVVNPPRGVKEMIWGEALLDTNSCNYTQKDIISCDPFYGADYKKPLFPQMTLYAPYDAYGCDPRIRYNID